MTGFPPILIDGEPASTDDLTYLALVNYGAYTSFSVEDGAARGLGRHLARLEASAVELFGKSPGEDRLRDLMRGAVEGRDACWLRVSLFSPELWARTPSWRGVPKVMTMAADPPPPLAASLRVATRVYARDAPHLKHTALFGLIQSRRQAQDAGFDDAIFVDEAGLISEGSLWNIGFVKGDRVTWPAAPMLAGVTQVLIEEELASVGLTSETRPLHLSDLPDFDQAFICNSATPACAVTAIGDHAFSGDPVLIQRLEAAWASNTPEAI
ncbi:aminotransferase class IV [Brevundimonas goettingensis]|uniref:Probable branched-chain-amino-acid aminotransferase n=1 Tax=Brevundimonas goettingensis TaxID=2774190 RepID=A0A975GUG2_9CAUL|nr:aminotransferase class IV [Brevundimonas goettingensis]QTC89982.1 aminotransferase class IV [Brevundimonas goettingensis]